ncbi:beta-ketoacyl synthase [Streptomyces sp. NBC_01408]|uniref:beta-ketoacyl-[acyl-carrier-protein] synthase family protein n=1 Tax=Streptomyces sp. NBC_01408 TaxID=2903855 RepID=UPI0022567562|nr:beta-ketoacyl synthase N-terminal-like domain-containing protein [Streptomyces sp. NBC_01408]MCX4693185.1 beta-ketoacyl-[acyl-carrier-protein] synthase family protein [Streptomyces sp. NBC_01408]
MEEVLITGLGAISHLGTGADAFWHGLIRAESAPGPAADPHARMDITLMYSVPEPPEPEPGPTVSPASRLAVAAAREALADAALGAVAPSRLAVVIGTGMGDAGLHEQWRTDGPPQDGDWSPVFSVASEVSEWLGAQGPSTSISNACAASGFGLSAAAELIRTGAADVVVAGGAEAYSRVALACFNRLGAIDPQECRPFDANRRGTVFGEGAGILVLESAAHAAARNAPRVYAKLAGEGWSCDAHHATAPDPSGTQIVRAMREAMERSGAKAEDVGCVVPHGTGTELNDVVESQALHTVLGSGAARTPLYSLKALVGHTGGAAAALGTVAAALILHHRAVPPNRPVAEPDPACEVRLPVERTALEGPFVIVNAYAFGGNNVSLVLQEAGA